MAYELIPIPDAADLPAHILNPELAKAANEDAAFGISTGFPPRVKLNGKAFALVDGNGAETPIPMGKLFKGPDDNLYLKTVVLRAKKTLQKAWYATAFNPNAEAQAPDCFSNDGERPDASIATPQCDICANCPQNAYGSGKDQAGNPTQGKACADNKILAVFVPNSGPHSMKLPPASLKNFGLYVKTLTARGIPVGNVFTLIGFDAAQTFPVLTFQYGGPVPETALEKLAAMAVSPEAEEIVNQRITASAKTAPAPAKPEPTKAAKPAAKPKAVKAEPKVEDDLGLGGEPETKQEPEAAVGAELSDEDIQRELGLL